MIALVACYVPGRRGSIRGGNRERAFNDLWGWDGERWSLLSSSGPSARNSVTFDYDTRRKVAILVGGRTSGGLLEDTWEWDGQRWRERAGRGPGVRLHHFAAYDERRGRLVLYGGLKPLDGRTLERLTDTWEWDGATWTRRDARGIEAFPSSMTYDDRRGQVVMVAVDATSPPDRERPSAMWGWTGDAWSRISERFGDPALSPSQPMTSDPDGLLLLDGAMHKGNTAITWLWRNGRWAPSGAAAPTPQRVSHAMAFDRRRNRSSCSAATPGSCPAVVVRCSAIPGSGPAPRGSGSTRDDSTLQVCRISACATGRSRSPTAGAPRWSVRAQPPP